MQKIFSSLRARVLLLIAIPFAVMLGMIIYHSLGEREERLAAVRERLLGTTRLMAAEKSRIVEQTHRLLLDVSRIPEVRNDGASADCNNALAAILAQEGDMENIGVAQINGDLTCNAVPLPSPVNIADRAHFQRVLQTRSFVMGDYIVSRRTGQGTIAAVYPVFGAAGDIQRVVYATFSLDRLSRQLRQGNYPQGARLVVIDATGIILARFPDPERWVGKSAPPDMPLAKTVLKSGGEGTADELGLDGLRRIFAFTPLHMGTTGNAYLWVAIPKHAIVGQVEREFIWSLLSAFAMLVLTFGIFWLGSERLYLGRIVALGRAAARLGKGEIATRTGLQPGSDEIAQLAQSFDQMAEALELKEKQLTRANRALRVISAGNRVMLNAKDERQLLEETCRAIVENGGYHTAWIGYAENDTQKNIRPVAQWGTITDDFFENTGLTWGETESGRTPPGNAIRNGAPVIVQDIPSEAGPEPWRQNALRCGCGSCVALPLRVGGNVIGVLNACAGELGAFGDEEVGLLREAAADLSYGIAALRGMADMAPLKAALSTSEQRVRAAAEASLDALCLLKSVRDRDNNIVDFEFVNINASAEQMLGMSRDKVVGQKLRELLPINRIVGLFGNYAQVVNTGAPLEEEFAIDIPEIKAKWLRHQVVRVEDGIAVFLRDITAWKAIGDRLRESEEKYHSLVEAVSDWVWRIDEKYAYTYCSPKVRDLLGYEPLELIGKSPFDLMPAAEAAKVAAVFEALVSERKPLVALENVNLRKDGREVVLETSGVPIFDSRGNFKGYQGIDRDITERKRAQQAELEQFKLAEAFFNHSVSCLAILDRNFNFIRVNEAYARAARKDIGEFAGRNHFEMYPSDAQPIFEEVVRAKRPHAAFTRAFVYPDQPERGTTYWDWTLVPILDRDGEVEYLVFSLNEVTERKRAEEEQRAAALYARSLIEASLDPLVTISPQGKITDVNRMTEEVTGVARTDLIGTDFTDYFTDPEQARAGYRQVLAQGYVRDYPLTIRHRAGRTTDVLYNAAVYRNETGELQGVFAAARDITERKQSDLALARANRALRTLSACNEALVRAGNEPDLLNAVCQLIVKTGGYRMAWVGFAENDPGKMVRPMAQYGSDEGYLEAAKISWADNERGCGPTGTAIRTGTVQVNQNFLTDPRVALWRNLALERGFQSAIALPFKFSAGTLSMLTIYAPEPDAFDEAEVALLQELAENLAFGIVSIRTRVERDRITFEHKHHEEALRQGLEDSIKAIADTVEMRDPYTAGHQRRVGRLAVAISKELGLPEETIHGIELGASIHDLGKINVPAEILSKPTKLTDIEFMLIKVHAQAGYNILKDIKFPWPIAFMVWQHHERLDGTGYPLGLKGDQILLESKIMAVADVVEAMASHRPYRAALGVDVALKEIERGRGTAFDAAVVDACMRIFQEKRFAFSA